MADTVTVTNRARNVCHACMLRKKACDKILPTCGFCASHQRLCRYDLSQPKSRVHRASNPGRYFVPLRSPSPTLTPTRPSTLCVSPQSVDESLNQLAQHYTQLTKLTYDSIIDHYFRAFHKWLPALSPDSLRRDASRYREEGRLPPADFTVLLLTMLLNILPTLDPSLRPPRASQEILYTTTKSALSQAQASLCTSLRLVQAALLIALREYASLRPETAYISMMTCAGLARVMGIKIPSVSDSRLEAKERENLAWSIAMLERLILCEMDQRDLQPQTEYPGPDCRLPSDFNPTAGLESQPGSDLQALNQGTLPGLDAADAALFGRQAQSVFLLERLLFITRSTARNPEIKLAELTELDSKVRSFLEVLLNELDWWQTLVCVSTALCVRLLFLLHQSILDTLEYPKSESDHQNMGRSSSGLDMVCRWVLDVVKWQGEDKAMIMPICTFYNLRAATKRLQERNKHVVVELLSRVIDDLLGAQEAYHKTWVF
ncbi:hypothetical protein A1O3_03768 [Capronia epimyces CBS 606.96]|uniref:Zn(2)-C6 fungal-type domain-containing protein n=1 Tax=Capronia epimyces CBS 606.96 TaxID=1182542 RepID=W9YX05_9EURO|nr:uncharacterized protein A1O3_03768 [Capronia epimyces CBS 606.96]EXJ86814.1 hypothetical protein A1O3_03768 [Capronia epimyces CBS 606.96]